jgi:quercetin dioxygenase-like cupin family protein
VSGGAAALLGSRFRCLVVEVKMKWAMAMASLALAAACGTATAQDAKPSLLKKQVVQGMPRGAEQEVTVLTATFKPGDKTAFHTHRFPVTVYVIAGTFTLDLEGLPTVVVRAGEAFVEPPSVRMTGYNRSATEELKVVIFYVGDPNTPFLDVVH